MQVPKIFVVPSGLRGGVIFVYFFSWAKKICVLDEDFRMCQNVLEHDQMQSLKHFSMGDFPGGVYFHGLLLCEMA